jgi:mannose-6-phosphate isomerase-like protein (cupin superfamily)
MYRNRTIASGSTVPAKVIRNRPQDEYWFHEGCHILEVSNHPEDPLVSIARARVEPGTGTSWHRLAGIWERYLIIQGEGIVEVGELEPTVVLAGDIVRIPPDTPQRISNTGNQDLVFYAICSPRFTPECYQALGTP